MTKIRFLKKEVSSNVRNSKLINVHFVTIGMVLTTLKYVQTCGLGAGYQVDLKTRQEKLFLIPSLISPFSGNSNTNFSFQPNGLKRLKNEYHFH